MKGKLSLLVAIILAILGAIAKTQCGYDKADTITKVIASATNDQPQHAPDTVRILTPVETIKYRTSTVYKTLELTDTALVFQTVTDTVRYDPWENGDLPNTDVFEDSTEEIWGKAKLRILSEKGQIKSWSVQAEPNPCPGVINMDSLNRIINEPIRLPLTKKPFYAGAGAYWSVTRNTPAVGLHVGKDAIGAQVLVNKVGVEAVGFTYTKTF